MKTNSHERAYWESDSADAARWSLPEVQVDLIVANDIEALPMACILKEQTGASLVLDAHEWKPGHFGDKSWDRHEREMWVNICTKYLPHVDAMFTVCQGIAELYLRHFGVRCEVLTNAPFFANLQPFPPKGRRIRLVYHGAVSKRRRSADVIRLIDLLDERFHLEMIPIAPDSAPYLAKIRKLAAQRDRVTLRAPVRTNELAQGTNHYDIGIHLLPPNSENSRLALPNKLFEYVQARLGIAIWPSPEMKRIVEQYDLGVVSDAFTLESIAARLNALTTDDIRRFKENSHRAAEELCAEENQQRFLSTIDTLLTKAPRYPREA
jgi:hypothetical protein